jgi:hypothetical protein
MTSEEAKLVLCAYRPGDSNYIIERALKQASRDPELAAWLAEQIAFDRQMTESLTSPQVPSHLRQAILQEHQSRKIYFLRRPVFAWGMAAALILGGALFIMLHQRPSNSIEHFRAAMIQELWTIDNRARFRSWDIAEVRKWLEAQGSTADFSLPSTLDELRVRDARVVNWSDQKVTSLCLIGHGRHLHVFVVPTAALASSSLGAAPEFELCHGLNTLAWTDGPNTYLLSGAHCVSLIMPRRAGHRFFAG